MIESLDLVKTERMGQLLVKSAYMSLTHSLPTPGYQRELVQKF
jgi:hypothetical protein